MGRLWRSASLAPVATSGDYADLSGPPIVHADLGTAVTVNPATNGLSAIDSTPIPAGIRMALSGSVQNNGIWLTAAGPWTRVSDYATDAQIRQSVVRCSSWTGAGNGFSATLRNTNTSAINVGVTDITFAHAETMNGTRHRIGFLGRIAEWALEVFTAGGTTPGFTFTRASGSTGALTLQQNGSGSIGILGSGGVRLGSSSGNPIFDVRKGSTTVAANTSVAAGARQTINVTVAGSLNNFGASFAAPQGVAVPAGLSYVGAWCTTNGTIVVAYQNTTAASVSWPASTTTINAVWFSI